MRLVAVAIRRAFAIVLVLGIALGSSHCRAWGSDGHRVVALIAAHYLTPATRERVAAVLADDSSADVARAIADASTWADTYRDSDRNGAGLRYRQTYRWHFINLDLQHPNLYESCFGHPPLQSAQVASRGPGRACIVDKIEQFRAEWLAPDTTPAERLLALRFLLHLVGDLHQPLHASDNADYGGNLVAISGPGLKAGSLHSFWDTQVVRRLAPRADVLAPRLIARISSKQRTEWRRGNVASWSIESNSVARSSVYGALPPASTAPAPSSRKRIAYRLPQSYVDDAEHIAALQLSRAGVRLAYLLEPVDAKPRTAGAR